ncbi:MAG: hypothetical protein V1660_00385 [archaeon]
MKCELCNCEIEETFLGKIKGSVVLTKEGEKNKLHHVCSKCQKKHGKDIKKQFAKIN